MLRITLLLIFFTLSGLVVQAQLISRTEIRQEPCDFSGLETKLNALEASQKSMLEKLAHLPNVSQLDGETQKQLQASFEQIHTGLTELKQSRVESESLDNINAQLKSIEKNLETLSSVSPHTSPPVGVLLSYTHIAIFSLLFLSALIVPWSVFLFSKKKSPGSQPAF